MTLRDLMARDALKLVRQDRLGESVTVHFKAGGSRTFYADVRRLDLEPLGQGTGAVVRVADVFIPYSATDGVEALADGDEIECVLTFGVAAVRCRILEILNADEGGFLVRVQK